MVFCLLYCPALTTVSDHWEDHNLDYTDFCQVMSLLFNTPSRFIIAFLPRSNCLLISWLQSLSAVILEPKKRKSVTISAFYPSVCHAAMGLNAMILVVGFFFLYLTLSRLFHSPPSPSSRVSLVPLLFLPLEWYPPHTRGRFYLMLILIPVCDSPSPASLMARSACRLDRQTDSRQPCCASFSILNQPVVPHRALTVAS